MATIQRKGENWYCQFLHGRRRHTFAVGEVSEAEARTLAARDDYVLMRLRQGLRTLPAGGDIVAFVQHDGKPPAASSSPPLARTLGELRDAYLAAFGQGAIEANTLDTARIHLGHVEKTLGTHFDVVGLRLEHLQKHVDRRRKDVAGVTIEKEIDTFRSVRNWSTRTGLVGSEFTSRGLVYPKDREKLPFMTWSEIERRIAAGGDTGSLWECVDLTPSEQGAFLADLESLPGPAWVYPMVLFAAHTGARRSEAIRARVRVPASPVAGAPNGTLDASRRRPSPGPRRTSPPPPRRGRSPCTPCSSAPAIGTDREDPRLVRGGRILHPQVEHDHAPQPRPRPSPSRRRG